MEELVYGPFIEQWKTTKKYPDYDISSYGRVKSFKYGKERILKPTGSGKNRNYLFVNISTDIKYVAQYIHQLVAQYIPNPNNLPFINHKDGNTLNNHNLNLEWTSPRENVCHGINKNKTSSQYIGVSWHKRRDKWQSAIYMNNKLKYLGYFNTELEAYHARCDYEKENEIINKYL